jgi:protein-disulfide isomerase
MFTRSGRATLVLLALGSILVAGVLPACAQSADEIAALKKEIAELKASQAALQRDVQDIKDIINAARQGIPPNLVISTADAPVKGDSTAKLTLVEFSDYQCPFCGQYIRTAYPQIDKEYVQTGKVRYVFKDFPLAQLHPNATKAAEAAACAADQGKFWEMHDKLFANQKALALTDLATYATAIGADAASFGDCLKSGKHAPKVQESLTLGARSGVRATPTFYLGLTNPDGSVKVVRAMSGAAPFDSFKQVIEELLNAK